MSIYSINIDINKNLYYTFNSIISYLLSDSIQFQPGSNIFLSKSNLFVELNVTY